MGPDNVLGTDLTQEDSDEAEGSVEGQKETFLHNFLSLCIRDMG